MLSKVALGVAALILTFPRIAPGQGLPYRSGFGSELVYQCAAYVRDTSSPNGSQCFGYIDGFLDGVSSQSSPRNQVDMTKAYCFTDTSVDTLIRVYLAFMEKNPKYLDEAKGKSLRSALHDAYPCHK